MQTPFLFKSQPEDFVVEEDLWFLPSWFWDFLYIQITKRDRNTMDILQWLSKHCNLAMSSLSVCWLKDKKSLSTQRLAIDTKDPSYNKQKIETYIQSQATIQQSNMHHIGLTIGAHRANIFHITIKKRAICPSIQNIQTALSTRIANITANWLANAYGIQRFWKNLRNIPRAIELLTTKMDTRTYVSHFIIKSYQNIYFNSYAKRRRDNKQLLIDWDIVIDKEQSEKTTTIWVVNNNMIQCEDKSIITYTPSRVPTWPLIWPMSSRIQSLQAQHHWSDSYSLEKVLWTDPIYTDTIDHNMRMLKINWHRRPLFVHPSDLEWTQDNEKIILSFGLPPWSYATIVLWYIFADFPDFVKHYQLYIPELR